MKKTIKDAIDMLRVFEVMISSGPRLPGTLGNTYDPLLRQSKHIREKLSVLIQTQDCT